MSRRAKFRKAGAHDSLFLYGIHAVNSALKNPDRRKSVLYATESALSRLDESAVKSGGVKIEMSKPQRLESLTARDAVHQGAVLRCEPLDVLDSSELFLFQEASLLLALDQITDPHNLGAVLRAAVAFGVDGIIAPHRHSAAQSAVTAKSASGALDMVPLMETRSLFKCLGELAQMGFETIGLDSAAPHNASEVLRTGNAPNNASNNAPEKARQIVLVLGSEGKGLRQKTRESCTILARLDMPGAIKSLNVSNAATLCLALAKGF